MSLLSLLSLVSLISLVSLVSLLSLVSMVPLLSLVSLVLCFCQMVSSPLLLFLQPGGARWFRGESMKRAILPEPGITRKC